MAKYDLPITYILYLSHISSTFHVYPLPITCILYVSRISSAYHVYPLPITCILHLSRVYLCIGTDITGVVPLSFPSCVRSVFYSTAQLCWQPCNHENCLSIIPNRYSGVTVKVEAGVTFRIKPNIGFLVLGRLLANGLTKDKIRFLPVEREVTETRSGKCGCTRLHVREIHNLFCIIFSVSVECLLVFMW